VAQRHWCRSYSAGKSYSAVIDQLRIPIWAEARFALEHAALRRHPVFRGDGVTPGDGAPVLLVPGFLAGDLSLAVMAQWLARIGYRPCRAGIRANVDCTSRALERLEGQLERFADRHARQVMIVGQSRGGSLARILAVRRPDLVAGIVCLGSPVLDPLAVHPIVRAHVEAVALLGSLGIRGVFSHACRFGVCCRQARVDASAVWPEDLGFTSVYSRSDGIVDWRSCLDPHARHVEVRSSHCGMSVNPAVYEVVAEALVVPPAQPARAAA
jgi:pimeloyl-ACP methyl ester carboxylesterase